MLTVFVILIDLLKKNDNESSFFLVKEKISGEKSAKFRQSEGLQFSAATHIKHIIGKGFNY